MRSGGQNDSTKLAADNSNAAFWLEATNGLHRTDFDVADKVRQNGNACNNDNKCNRANHEISHVELLAFLVAVFKPVARS
jgi:hypothetical protein